MKFRLVSLLIAGLSASVLLAGDEPKHCNASAKECDQQIRSMLTGRRYLGISVVDLKPGIVIKSVVADSPAERANFKAGDRLIAVNGQKMTESTVQDFKRVLAGARDTLTKHRPIVQVEDARVNPPVEQPDYTCFKPTSGSISKVWIPNEHPKLGVAKELGWTVVP